MTKRGYTLHYPYVKGCVAIVPSSKDKRKLIGIDAMNMFSGKLSSWGEQLGIAKQVVDFTTDDDATLMEYCRNDTLILLRLWQRWLTFREENRCGAWASTAAATAFNCWRHSHYTHKVYVHGFKPLNRMERDGYYGGRTDCYRYGIQRGGP